jgi:hypothetical protein
VQTELACAYAASGSQADARRILNLVLFRSRHEWIDPYYISIEYGCLNDKEQAFAWLNRALDSRSPAMPFLRVEPRFDGLRTDLRLANMLRQIRSPAQPAVAPAG